MGEDGGAGGKKAARVCCMYIHSLELDVAGDQGSRHLRQLVVVQATE